MNHWWQHRHFSMYKIRKQQILLLPQICLFTPHTKIFVHLECLPSDHLVSVVNTLCYTSPQHHCSRTEFHPLCTPREISTVMHFPKEDSSGKGKHMLPWDVKLYRDRYINIYKAISTSKIQQTRILEVSGCLQSVIFEHHSLCLKRETVNLKLFFMAIITEGEINLCKTTFKIYFFS